LKIKKPKKINAIFVIKKSFLKKEKRCEIVIEEIIPFLFVPLNV
jgi:hypothetical protein